MTKLDRNIQLLQIHTTHTNAVVEKPILKIILRNADKMIIGAFFIKNTNLKFDKNTHPQSTFKLLWEKNQNYSIQIFCFLI